MKKIAKNTLPLLSLALILGACGDNSSTNATPAKTPFVLGATQKDSNSNTRWIVELEADPTLISTQSIDSQQSAFRAQAQQLGIKYQELKSFNTLFNGFAIEASSSEAGRISTMAGVLNVSPDAVIELPQTKIELETTALPDMASAVVMTGADVAQNELGLTGKGVKVGIIDTGLDLKHPAFKGRVVASYDLVGDAYTGHNAPVPGGSVQDCAGHGTHVAGIVGGNDASTGFKGVAPEVSFGVYRVFGCEGSTMESVMVDALERAYKDGMQVVNLSIGSAFSPWNNDPSAKVGSRMVKKGMIVVASAGNSGANGQYSMGGVSMGDNVISVASVSNTKIELGNFSITPGGNKIGYMNASSGPEPIAGKTYPIAKAPNSTTTLATDGCSPSQFAANSLTGKAALIRRGTCTFYEKALNAQKAGAAAVIIYNRDAGYITPSLTPSAGSPEITIPVVFIPAAAGALIDSKIASGVSLTFNSDRAPFDSPTANTLDSYSSYGMSATLELKPDLAAPGGNIKSAYPLALKSSGYEILSGTSMASPHVAGAAALLLQAYPNIKSKDMGTVLMNTSSLRWYRSASGTLNSGIADHVVRQGAGMIDIVSAHQNAVRATPNKLSLGDSATFATRKKVVVLKNTGAINAKYVLYHYPALTVSGTTFAPTPAQTYASVSVNGSSVDGTNTLAVNVAPGAEVELNIDFTPPAAATDKSQYGGYIFLEGVNTPNLVVPYAGFKGDYKSIKVLGDIIAGGTAYNAPFLADDVEDSSYEEDEVPTAPIDYTFKNVSVAGKDIMDAPYLMVNLAHPSRRLTLELLDSAGAVADTLDVENYLGRSCTNNLGLAAGTCNAFEKMDWDGKLSSGKDAPAGTYALRIKVIKATGNPDKPAANDIETYTSQKFNVVRK